MPTKTANDVVPGHAIDFDPFPETWTINPGITVGSTGNFGIVSVFAQSTLDNFGTAYSAVSDAVVFAGSNGLIKNESGAAIEGLGIGVRLGGNLETIPKLRIHHRYEDDGQQRLRRLLRYALAK
jgi:hypothetical protein